MTMSNLWNAMHLNDTTASRYAIDGHWIISISSYKFLVYSGSYFNQSNSNGLPNMSWGDSHNPNQVMEFTAMAALPQMHNSGPMPPLHTKRKPIPDEAPPVYVIWDSIPF